MLRKLVVATSLLAYATTATAQVQTPRSVCHPSDEIAEVLSKKYGEHVTAIGLQNNGKLFQIYASEKSGTWTAVITSPDGISCIIAAGTDWSQLLPPTINGPQV